MRFGSRRGTDRCLAGPTNLSMRRDERGVAMVEFALVLPLLLVCLLGVIDFAKALNYWIDQTSLANQAARMAAVNKNPAPNLQAYIKAQAGTPELRDRIGVCVSFPSGGSKAIGSPVTVKVIQRQPWLQMFTKPNGIKFFGIRFHWDAPVIVGSATMRIEQEVTAVDAGNNLAPPGLACS
jgi:Flp pilus assembly pilin Flp